KLGFYRLRGPNARNSCRRMWKKEIVRVKKNQDRMPRKWPGTDLCDDLTPVLVSEHGSDPVAVLGDYRSRVIRRTIVDDDDLAKGVVLAKSAIDRRGKELLIVVVDNYDANTPGFPHNADPLPFADTLPLAGLCRLRISCMAS